MKQQSGFTLIELIMVIVILGILAATALPKFVSFKSEAETAALAGVAGAMSSANTINYATRSFSPTSGVAVSNCSSISSLLEGSAVPAGYTVAASGISAGATGSCTVTQTSTGATANFSLTGIN